MFLRGILNGKEYTLVNVYCPNTNPGKYATGVLTKIEDFRRGRVIVAGDLNLCMEPGRDNTSHVRGTGGVWMNKLKKKLHQCQLVDAWRMQHQKTRDYTYSPVHATYSRLDYIFVDHRYWTR